MVFFSGESMPTSDSDTARRSLVGYGVAVAIHVSRRGTRWTGAASSFSQNR